MWPKMMSPHLCWLLLRPTSSRAQSPPTRRRQHRRTSQCRRNQHRPLHRSRNSLRLLRPYSRRKLRRLRVAMAPSCTSSRRKSSRSSTPRRTWTRRDGSWTPAPPTICRDPGPPSPTSTAASPGPSASATAPSRRSRGLAPCFSPARMGSTGHSPTSTTYRASPPAAAPPTPTISPFQKLACPRFFFTLEVAAKLITM